jgi:leucyl-tRNA synthetase
MHLLYARFFQKALFDLALVPTPEPFNERFNRGIILGPDGAKMSKSKGNVINPDEFVEKYGADAVRLYLAFIGPYNEPGSYPWNLDGVAAMRKFLDRVVRLTEKAEETPITDSIRRHLSRCAEKVAQDSERFKFNTAIAALMTLLNELESEKSVARSAVKEFIVLLAPFAPHLAEHLWEKFGEGSVHAASWSKIEHDILSEEVVTITVQVNGKRRGSISLPSTASEADALALANTIEVVSLGLNGKVPKRVIFVPGKILNLVI